MSEKIISLAGPYTENDARVMRSWRVVPFRARIYRPVAAAPAPARATRGVRLSARDLGEAYGRLASMVLASKLADGEIIGTGKRAHLISLAGIPEPFASHDMTNLVFYASADQLGKGGGISNVVKSVSKAVSTVTKSADQVMRAAAPIVSAVPVIGPAIGKTMMIVANTQDIIAGSSLKSLVSSVTQNPASVLGRALGAGAGNVGAIVQAGAQGVADLVGDLGAAGSWAASGVASLIGSGENVFHNFASSAWSGLEASNPSLSGELSSLFQGIGSEYTKFSGAFNGWNAALKSSPAGTYFGKMGGQFYSVVKDAAGHFTLKKHDASVVPGSIASQVPDGQILPTDPNLFAANSMAGAFPQVNPRGAAGVPQYPAGISMPGGPGAAGLASDQSFPGILQQIIEQALGVKTTSDAKVKATGAKAVQTASMPTWLIIGVGLAGVVFVVRGGVSLAPKHRRRARR